MLLENKPLLIHVACEVVVLGVLIFWIHRKTSNLWDQVDELSQRLEDQEDTIQNHSRLIKEIIQMLNNQRVQTKSQSIKPPPHNRPPVKRPQPPPQIEEPDFEDEFNETESDMDEALKDELAELELGFTINDVDDNDVDDNDVDDVEGEKN
jgi:hypothetical protein